MSNPILWEKQFKKKNENIISSAETFTLKWHDGQVLGIVH